MRLMAGRAARSQRSDVAEFRLDRRHGRRSSSLALLAGAARGRSRRPWRRGRCECRAGGHQIIGRRLPGQGALALRLLADALVLGLGQTLVAALAPDVEQRADALGQTQPGEPEGQATDSSSSTIHSTPLPTKPSSFMLSGPSMAPSTPPAWVPATRPSMW